MKSGPWFFGPAERRVFGWFHEPAASAKRARIGVVLCNPFGYEAICTHRSVRHFAEAFARAGFPALRFDYYGTGDSPGSEREPDIVRAWLASIDHAIDVLKSEAGVDQVCLWGHRLGATLAAAAAARRTDCGALIALQPVVAPALYVRELQTLHAWNKLPKAPDGISGVDPGDIEAAGFVITAQTNIDLQALDPMKQTKAPAPKILLLERADRPPSRWAERLTSLGAEVDARQVQGFVEMSWDSHRAVVPKEMIDASVEWLTKLEGPTAPTSVTPVHGLSRELALDHEVAERLVFVEPKKALFGIVTHGPERSRNRRAILLLNTGTQHRIGPNRLWVTLARHWAEMGVVVLRLDVSGLGDSPPLPGEEENKVYANARTQNIADAVDYLKREWNVRRVDMVGICSGAYHSFRAVVAGVPADSLTLINQQCYFWKPGDPVDPSKNLNEAQRLRGTALKASAWKKLLAGKVQIRASGRVLARRVFNLVVSRSLRAAVTLGLPLKTGLPAELRTVVKKKTFVRIVFSENDVGEIGEPVLKELAGPLLDRLQDQGVLSVERIRATDHTFTAIWMQRVLTQRLDAWLALGSR